MNGRFLSNTTDTTFLDQLLECIEQCEEFAFSVSFIKFAGLRLIRDALERRLAQGVNGRLLTTTYKNFTDLPSLELFLSWQEKYPNFRCRIDHHSIEDSGFHSKGYMFLIQGKYHFLVGSTNLTHYALRKNVEWNVSLELKRDDATILLAHHEFEILWSQCRVLDKQVIQDYKTEIEVSVSQWDFDENDFDLYSKDSFSPNPMQIKALREIQRYRKLGAERAMVIAATGSGKTYLAAFDARRFNAQKLLFVVHRDTILVDATHTFANVFKSRRTYGIYTGATKERNADFLFATNVTMAKNLSLFDPDEFDYIVFDECHHITGDTYQKIVNYFKPRFTLGLTATPERLDNKDVFDYFGNNVPYELRLRDAINHSLVVPFHYFGIRDDLADYSRNADSAKALSLAYETQNHFDFIVAEMEKHAPRDTKLKALVFCRNKAHAKIMANAFVQRGYPAATLLGEDNVTTRVQAYSSLQSDDSDLQVLCAVDILNEGIDIPAVNMVVFLRPTESTTIFIQQLGRGLRKSVGKEFLTVLDFIGNDYDRAFNVVRALGGLSNTVSMTKPDMRKAIATNFAEILIPGVTIHFDQKSIEEVLNSIERQNFNRVAFLKTDYANFKSYLGIHDKAAFPLHMDYLQNDAAPDLIRFLRWDGGTASGSYYRFLKGIGEEVPPFSEEQEAFLARLSSFLPLVRKDDYLILNGLLKGTLDREEIKSHSKRIDDFTIDGAFQTLLKKQIIHKDESGYVPFIPVPATSDFEAFIADIVNYGLARYDIEFGEFDGMFKRYGAYDKEKILQTIYGTPKMFAKGTLHDTANQRTYLFVNLKKDLHANEGLAYKDRFLSPAEFQWESVNNTTEDNAEGKKLLASKEVYLFLRRVESEDGITMPFVFMGKGEFHNWRKSSNEGKPTLIFSIELEQPIDEEYHFEYEVPSLAKA